MSKGPESEPSLTFPRRTALKTGGVAIASLFNAEVGKEDEPQFPQGVEIALCMYKKGSKDVEVYLLNVDQNSSVNISNDSSMNEYLFRWLPGGERAVFATISPMIPGGEEPTKGGLYLLDLATREKKQLNFNRNDLLVNLQPTDSKIAFLTASKFVNPVYRLYVMNYNGTEQEPVNTTNPITMKITANTSAGGEVFTFRKYALPAGDYFRILIDSKSGLIFPTTLPSGKEHIFGIERRILNPNKETVNVYTDLFYFKEGKNEAVPITKKFDCSLYNVSLTYDGKWVVFSGNKFNALSESREDMIFAVPLTGGEPKIILDLKSLEADQYREVQVRPQVKEKKLPSPRIRILFVPGLGSEVEGIGEGREKSDLFLEFQIQARENGFTGADFMVATWNGYEIDPKSGLYWAKGHTCQDTLSSHEERGETLFNLILDWFKFHPNDELVIMTHSEGFHPAFYAMGRLSHEIENNPNFNINPQKLKFIFTHAPALGLDKPGIDSLGEFFASTCKIGPLPSPGTLANPAGAYLVEAWNNRQSKAEEINEVVKWWREKGSVVASLGNWEDQAISIRFNLDVLESQIVPGAESFMFDLGTAGFGHDRVWKSQTGLKQLLELVGKQLAKEAQHK